MVQRTAALGRESWVRGKWKLFSSMQAGLVILGLIAISALFGIVYDSLFTSCFFRALEGLLCFNLAFCSIRRCKKLKDNRVDTADFLENGQSLENGNVVVALSQEQSANAARDMLLGLGYMVTEHKVEKGLVLCGERGRIALWGSLFVHISILLIAAGALIGGLFGFDTEVTLPVGSEYSVRLGAADNFTIRLQGFATERYQNGTVSDWISNVAVEKDRQQILVKEIKVNYPLSYNDVKIYQKSYGTALKYQVFDETGLLLKENVLSETENLTVDGAAGFIVKPMRYIPDYDNLNPMVSRSAESNNPYVLYVVYSAGREISWGAIPVGAFLRLGSSSVRFLETVPLSVLEIKYDPGLPLIWLGFILLTGGFFASMYIKHTRLYLLITREYGKCTVNFYASETKREEHRQTTKQAVDALSVSLQNTARGI